jgi:hypothetical protein
VTDVSWCAHGVNAVFMNGSLNTRRVEIDPTAAFTTPR